MAAYVINDMEITDPVVFEQYRQMSPATVAQYGGRFIVRGGAIEPLEGDWSPRRLVILEFASAAQARAWIDSPEYAPARRLRQASARSSIVLVEGVAAPAAV
jgi:uncharacterized protein (DUF1330 family)